MRPPFAFITADDPQLYHDDKMISETRIALYVVFVLTFVPHRANISARMVVIFVCCERRDKLYYSIIITLEEAHCERIDLER